MIIIIYLMANPPQPKKIWATITQKIFSILSLIPEVQKQRKKLQKVAQIYQNRISSSTAYIAEYIKKFIALELVFEQVTPIFQQVFLRFPTQQQYQMSLTLYTIVREIATHLGLEVQRLTGSFCQVIKYFVKQYRYVTCIKEPLRQFLQENQFMRNIVECVAVVLQNIQYSGISVVKAVNYNVARICQTIINTKQDPKRCDGLFLIKFIVDNSPQKDMLKSICKCAINNLTQAQADPLKRILKIIEEVQSQVYDNLDPRIKIRIDEANQNKINSRRQDNIDTKRKVNSQNTSEQFNRGSNSKKLNRKKKSIENSQLKNNQKMDNTQVENIRTKKINIEKQKPGQYTSRIIQFINQMKIQNEKRSQCWNDQTWLLKVQQKFKTHN